MSATTASRFQTASTAEALAIAFEHNPANGTLIEHLDNITPLVASALGLANGIIRAAPELVHKPSLHVLVVAPEALVIDQARWLQLAADLLEREHPINISVAMVGGQLLPIGPHAALIEHQPAGASVDRDECLQLNPPDMIYAPFMRMPTSLAQLPNLSWIGASVNKGIRFVGWACNPLEFNVITACISGGRLGEVNVLCDSHVFDSRVAFEVVPAGEATPDPDVAIEAIKNASVVMENGRSN